VRVAVLPFAPHGGEDATRLSGAMVNLLGTVLDGAGGLRTVDVAAVLTAARDQASLSPDDARAIARRLGARRYVVGDVVEGAPGRYTVSASVHDTDADSADSPRAAVEGAGADVFRLVNELAVQLLGSLGVQQSPRRLESMSTSSAVALKEYLAGETLMRRGQYSQAVEAFGRAVQADSLFALAWFRQGYAYGFTETSERGEQPLSRALALRERLSERDRRLAEALGALTAGDPEQAVRLYSALVYDYPDDVEGWFGRADAVLHFGPLYGLRMDSVSQAFERVLYLDPNHSEAQAHLPWAAGLEGRVGLLDSAATRIIAADSAGYYTPVFRLLRAFALGDSAALDRDLAASAKMDDLQRLLAVNMSATLRNPPGTARLARRLLIDADRISEVRAFGHLLAAHLELAGGRAGAARRELAAADSLDPAAALEDRALLTLLPFLRTPDSTIALVRARVEQWNAARVPPSASGNAWIVPHDSLHSQVRLYLLGALSARLRDAPGVARAALELRRFDSTTAAGAIGRSFADAVVAQSELAQGRPAEALRGFDSGRLGGRYARSWQRAYSSPFFSQSYERYLRAGALAGLGRDADALRWYSSVWMANAFDLVYLAPAQLEAAALYERAGDRAHALAAYRTFVELWRNADPELRPAVDRAQGRIAALEK
jgi:tetratricopeptide (TPR) repeat protein